MKRLLTIFVLAIAGCQTPSTRMTADESRKVISLARGAIVTSGVLSAGEERKLDSLEPMIAYYFMARPYADYTVRWRIGADEEVIVVGRGDIFQLENATVKRQKPNQSLQPTAPSGRG
jgi:hypothetical protein